MGDVPGTGKGVGAAAGAAAAQGFSYELLSQVQQAQEQLARSSAWRAALPISVHECFRTLVP